jgi:hypothetical protein
MRIKPLLTTLTLGLALTACNEGGQPPHAEPPPEPLPPPSQKAPPADAPAPAESEPNTPEKKGATS